MLWVPAFEVPLSSVEAREELVIKDKTQVEWRKNGLVMRIFEMDNPVEHALVARFSEWDAGGVWIVIVLSDKTLVSFDCASGTTKTMGLSIIPIHVLPCGDLGVVITSDYAGELHLQLLLGPQELMQAVVPSAILENFKTGLDELRFMDRNVAAVWSPLTARLRLFSVRLLSRELRMSAALVDDIGGCDFGCRQKAAILSPMRDWEMGEPGAIFTQKLQMSDHSTRKPVTNSLLAIHDTLDQRLFILSGPDLICHDDIEVVVPIAGFLDIPYVATQSSVGIELHSLFFPQLEALGIPVQIPGYLLSLKANPKRNYLAISYIKTRENVTTKATGGGGIAAEKEDIYRTAAKASTTTTKKKVGKYEGNMCIAIYDAFDADVLSCFALVREICGVEVLGMWVYRFLASRIDTDDDWEAFDQALNAGIAELDEPAILVLAMSLHMLSEEFSLYETKLYSAGMLHRLLTPIVRGWPGWAAYNEDSDSELVFESNVDSNYAEYSSRVKRTGDLKASGTESAKSSPKNDNDTPRATTNRSHATADNTGSSRIGNVNLEMGRPPCVLEMLAAVIARQTVVPTVLLARERAPVTWALFEACSRLHTSGTGLGAVLDTVRDVFPELVAGVQASFIQLAFMQHRLATTGSVASQPPRSEAAAAGADTGPMDANAAARPSGLELYDDKRLAEVQRLLNSSIPQECMYPVEIDDDAFAEKLPRWALALGSRALLASHGRAALELSSKQPHVWTQLTEPTIEFGGLLSRRSSGTAQLPVTITPTWHSLEEAEERQPWSVFATGVALGLSIEPGLAGINTMWTMTSAQLQQYANSALFSGFLYAMGLQNYLGELADWQFFEKLMAGDNLAKVASLVGGAASRMGSRDAKLTKLLELHVSELLPREMNVREIVVPSVEHGALIALGVLYFATGARSYSSRLLQRLRDHGSTTGPGSSAASSSSAVGTAGGARRSKSKGSDASSRASNEENKFTTGLALGLMNCGQGDATRELAELLDSVVRPHQLTFSVAETMHAVLAAALGTFVGTNDARVAARLAYSADMLLPAVPSTWFGRALVRNLVLWDGVGTTQQWLNEQLANFPVWAMRAHKTGELGEDSTILEFYYYRTGVLVAMAMRHAGTLNADVIDTLCGQLEDIYVPFYLRQIATYSSARSVLYRQFTRVLATVIGHLALAVAAVAAGSGNLRVLRLLRLLWQIGPQLHTLAWAAHSGRDHEFDDKDSSKVEIDSALIAQAMGWLFMSSGQRSFRNDPESVGLLTLTSFVPLLGGSNLNPSVWTYLRFMWVRCTEPRLLAVAGAPGERVHVDVVYTSGTASAEVTPLLLPPLATVASIEVTDDHYEPAAVEDVAAAVRDGLRVTRALPDRLNASLEQLEQLQTVDCPVPDLTKSFETIMGGCYGEDTSSAETRHLASEIFDLVPVASTAETFFDTPIDELRVPLEKLARHPESPHDSRQIAVLLALSARLGQMGLVPTVFAPAWLEQLQLRYWLSTQEAVL